MKTLEWTNVDKTAWGPGQWQNEPDKRQWTDGATGLACLAVRNPSSGNWCGYVGVPDTHPWHSISYNGCVQKPPCGQHYCDHYPDVRVHGGLTFSDKCADVAGDHSRYICHLPEPGEPDNVWWFGFDCNHSGDRAPGYVARYPGHSIPGEHYRNLRYVEGECARLARQLADAKQ